MKTNCVVDFVLNLGECICSILLAFYAGSTDPYHAQPFSQVMLLHLKIKTSCYLQK